MTIDKQSFEKVFEPLKKNSEVAILLQRAPDPDALGAAAGIAMLLKEVFKLNAKTFHFGDVSHPQNKSMKNSLHIPLTKCDTVEDFEHEKYECKIVLDTDYRSTGFQKFGNPQLERCQIRIDHHQMESEHSDFEDVRKVGSTCAIVWEYLKEYKVDLDKHKDTTTALLLGIKTDTLDFTSSNTSDLDMEAYRALLGSVDRSALADIINFPLPGLVFETEAQAYKDRRVTNTTLVSFIGECSSQHRDIIPYIADRFSRMEGVNTVIIMGIIENHLIASVRSIDSRVDVLELCNSTFGKEFSGAKEGSGGTRIPLGPVLECIKDEETKEKVMKEISDNFTERVFSHLGEE